MSHAVLAWILYLNIDLIWILFGVNRLIHGICGVVDFTAYLLQIICISNQKNNHWMMTLATSYLKEKRKKKYSWWNTVYITTFECCCIVSSMQSVLEILSIALYYKNNFGVFCFGDSFNKINCFGRVWGEIQKWGRKTKFSRKIFCTQFEGNKCHISLRNQSIKLWPNEGIQIPLTSAIVYLRYFRFQCLDPFERLTVLLVVDCVKLLMRQTVILTVIALINEER